jgi:hypothetical protein
MFARQNIATIVLAVVALFVTEVSVAQTGDPIPYKTEKRSTLAARDAAAKQLLLLMDTDKSGKVSRQEWMRYMEAEFDRLDKNKDGELDVKELQESQMHAYPVAPSSVVGK